MTRRDAMAFTKTDRVLHVIMAVCLCLIVVFHILGDHPAAIKTCVFIAAAALSVGGIIVIVRWVRPAR